MTLQEYNDNLRELANNTETRLSERVMVVGATRLLATMQNRIFRDGKDSNGRPIGDYSERPIYATKDQFVQKSAFKPVGKGGAKQNIRARSSSLVTKKTSSTVVKSTGRERTSMYLPGGYKEFRDIQGRPTGEVNLFLKGDLRLSYTLQAKEKEVLIGFNSEAQSLKRRGLEKHFKGDTGTIFPATEEEKEIYAREVVNELKTVQNEIINGL